MPRAGFTKTIKDAHRWAATTIDRAVDEEPVRPVMSEAQIVASRDLFTESDIPEHWEGTWYVRGVRYLQRATGDYDHPWTARGLGVDLGVLEHLHRTSGQLQRAVSEIVAHATAGAWRVDPRGETEADKLIARHVGRQLFGIAGGWSNFIAQAVRSMSVAGFAVFVRVDSEDGGLKRLAPRRPNTVRRWVHDERGQLAGVEFVSQDRHHYMIEAKNLVVITLQDQGGDYEGLSPTRPAAPWVRAKQLGSQLWVAGLEKWGSPVITIEDPEGPRSTGDSLQVVDLFDQASAEEFPVVKLGAGQKASILSPGSQLAEYEAFLRYCDEQILLPFSGEGALVGMTSHGARNLAEVKDSQHLRVAVHMAERIVEAINGDRWTAHNGVTRHITNLLLGVDHPYAYPEAVYALGDEDAPVDQILEAIKAGAVQLTDEVVTVMHERLGLPAPKTGSHS